MSVPSTDHPSPSAEDVRAVVSRLLASAQFLNTKRLQRFLRYIVEEALAGRAAALKGYTIGIAVYDRPENFDAEADTIVRVQAGQLRRRLALYYAGEGSHDAVRISLPRGSYVPHFRRVARPSAPPLRFVALGPSIGIATFEDYSADGQYTSLARAISDDITSKLSRFREFTITAGGAIDPIRPDLSTTLEAAGTDFLVVGSVQVAGDQLRVSLRLIEATSMSVVFADQFDRALTADNMMALQDELTARIAAALGTPFGVIAAKLRTRQTPLPDDFAAFSWCQRAQQVGLTADESELTLCRTELEKITLAHPTYAPGWAALARTHLSAARNGFGALPLQKTIDLAVDYARSAISCDPDDATGHHLLACALFHQGDMVGFEAAAQRSMSLNPHQPNVLAEYGLLLGVSGRWAEGRQYVDHAISISINPPFWFFALPTWDHYRRRQFDAAARILAAADPGAVIWYQALRAAVHHALGDHLHADAAKAKLLSLAPQFPAVFNEIFALWHLDANAGRLFEEHLRALGLLHDN